MNRLLKDLDSGDFDTCERASCRLEQHAELVVLGCEVEGYRGTWFDTHSLWGLTVVYREVPVNGVAQGSRSSSSTRSIQRLSPTVPPSCGPKAPDAADGISWGCSEIRCQAPLRCKVFPFMAESGRAINIPAYTAQGGGGMGHRYISDDK